MAATCILLNWDLTLWTLMSSNVVCPVLILLFLCLFTCFLHMPNCLARETYLCFAFVACNFCGAWISDYYILTASYRTKLLVGVFADLDVLHEPNELFVRVLFYYAIDLFSINLIRALDVGTLHFVDLSRFLNHVLKVTT